MRDKKTPKVRLPDMGGEKENTVWANANENEAAFQEPDDDAIQEQSKKQKLIEVFFDSLPTALSQLVIKYLLVATGSLLLSILLVVVTRRVEPTIILLGTAWGIWAGIAVVRDFRADRITERVLVCTNVSYSVFENRTSQFIGKVTSDRVRATFCDTNDPPTYYQYVIPGRKTSFVVGMPYVTYVRKSTPQILMAYLPL